MYTRNPVELLKNASANIPHQMYWSWFSGDIRISCALRATGKDSQALPTSHLCIPAPLTPGTTWSPPSGSACPQPPALILSSGQSSGLQIQVSLLLNWLLISCFSLASGQLSRCGLTPFSPAWQDIVLLFSASGDPSLNFRPMGGHLLLAQRSPFSGHKLGWSKYPLLLDPSFS